MARLVKALYGHPMVVGWGKPIVPSSWPKLVSGPLRIGSRVISTRSTMLCKLAGAPANVAK
eukprot:994541-Lingulodinium_polyedra.AAC.1